MSKHQNYVSKFQVAEQMAKDEERRKREAEEVRQRLDSEKRERGNEITQMFDRLRSENEARYIQIQIQISLFGT